MGLGFSSGKVADIWAELDLKDRGYHQKIAKAKTAGGGLASSLKAAMGGIGLAIVARGAIKAFDSILKASAENEEAMNLFNKTFGKSAAEVQAWSNVLVNRFGASKTEMIKLLGLFQDFFVPLGASRKEAANLSKQLVSLAGDLGSLRSIPLEQAATQLRSFLVGQLRAGQALGIAINQNILLAKIREQTGKTQMKQATEFEKVVAKIALAEQFSADALGDFAHTQNSLTNAARETKSAFSDVQNTLGDMVRIFVPVDEFINTLADGVGTLNTKLEKLNKVLPNTKATLGKIASLVFPPLAMLQQGTLIPGLAQKSDPISGGSDSETRRIGRERARMFNDVIQDRLNQAAPLMAERQAFLESIKGIQQELFMNQVVSAQDAKTKGAGPDLQFSDPREFLRVAQEAALQGKDPVVSEQKKSNVLLGKIQREEREQTRLLEAAGPLGP